jgi:archaellin
MANVINKKGVESVNGKRGHVTVVEDKNHVHDQSTPSATWEIDHPLDKKVNVVVTDTAGTVVDGRVTINDGSKVVVEFNAPFSGEAVLN